MEFRALIKIVLCFISHTTAVLVCLLVENCFSEFLSLTTITCNLGFKFNHTANCVHHSQYNYL